MNPTKILLVVTLFSTIALSGTLIASNTPKSTNVKIYQKIVDDYLLLHGALFKSSASDTSKSFLSLKNSVTQAISLKEDPYKTSLDEILNQLKKMEPGTVEDYRAKFFPLSQKVYDFVSLLPGDQVHVYYCPMVKKSWLQGNDKEVQNPYMVKMPLCGNKVGKK